MISTAFLRLRNAFGPIFLIACLSLGACSRTTFAETEDQKTIALILERDRLFWNAYNACDIESFKRFFTDDVEFYHDKGGITLGAAALTDSFRNNLCGNNSRRIRREPVADSVKVFPLHNGKDTYGAIISGEHLFYLTEPGKDEYMDSRANFTHLWLIKNGVAKMARVLSFDHRPVSPEGKRTETVLPHEKLDRFVGAYQAPKTGKVTVTREDNLLVLTADQNRFVLYPESENLFFTKERPLTFQFEKSPDAGLKLIVRENGAIAEEASREK